MIKREIKFRQWYEGKMRMLDHSMFGVGQIGFSDEHWVDMNDSDQEECVIMQYTGLKDRNGVEIYEGDIVRVQARTGIPHDLTVVFENGGFVLREGRKLFGSVAYAANPDKSGEVIGNIYEKKRVVQ